MKEKVINMVCSYLVICGIMLILAIFMRDNDIPFIESFVAVSAMAIFVTGALICNGEKDSSGSESSIAKSTTALVSCPKCGFFGIGSGGACTRCGSTRVKEVRENTNLISCPRCGYLGVGVSGYCPKCGSTRAKEIKR